MKRTKTAIQLLKMAIDKEYPRISSGFTMRLEIDLGSAHVEKICLWFDIGREI